MEDIALDQHLAQRMERYFETEKKHRLFDALEEVLGDYQDDKWRTPAELGMLVSQLTGEPVLPQQIAPAIRQTVEIGWLEFRRRPTEKAADYAPREYRVVKLYKD